MQNIQSYAERHTIVNSSPIVSCDHHTKWSWLKLFVVNFTFDWFCFHFASVEKEIILKLVKRYPPSNM